MPHIKSSRPFVHRAACASPVISCILFRVNPAYLRCSAVSSSLRPPSLPPSLGHSLTVLSPPPTDDLSVFADEGLPVPGQADGHDVLLEDHVPRQPHHGHVVAEVSRAVLGVHLLGLGWREAN